MLLMLLLMLLTNVYILLTCLLLRRTCKLAGTRSPLYRKLWRWDFAHVQLSSYSVRIYAPLTRIRPKNSIFACAIFGRHAAAFAAFTDSPIDPSYIREEERNTTQNIVPHSTPRSTPILLKFGGVTLRPSAFRLFKALHETPRFGRVRHYHSALLETASKILHFCLDSFSFVSRYFSILSSLSGRTRPHLALETLNFRNNIHKKL